MSERTFWIAALIVLTLATLIRVYALSINPFHHDEGINGWFTTNLVRRGEWTYDPANYHGPTLFYFALAAQTLLGLTDETLRLVPAVFGVGTIGLVLMMRPFIGPLAAVVAAALLAVSPGATYVSRYFIHEALVAFFTLAMVVALLYLIRTRRQRHLVFAAASAALLFATKETGIVAVAVLAIAVVVGSVYMRLRRSARDDAAPRRRPSRRSGGRAAASARPSRETLGSLVTADGAIAAALVFIALYGLFFTSFLSNPRGIVDSLATFTIWTQTGTERQVQPLHQYLLWMFQADAPILLLGAAGGLIVAWRANNPTAVFIGLWSLGITMAYSLVTYKTPWIALNMLVPLALLAGIGLTAIVGYLTSRVKRAAVAAVLAGALALSAYQAYDINFVHYDDEKYPYVFVHTTREIFGLIDETNRVGELSGAADQAGITFVTPDYWPLPWYYRGNPNAAFFGQIVDTEEPMIVANTNQEAELEPTIGASYRRTQVFRLRPGVDLVLYVRPDLAGH